MPSEANCKVLFKFEKGQTTLPGGLPWPPCEAESLWGELLASGRVRLVNVPFYAAGVSYLDEVLVKEAEAAPEEDIALDFFEFDSIVSHSGHGTVRAILLSEEDRKNAEDMVSALEKLGCGWESAAEPGTKGILAIDIPPNMDSSLIQNFIGRLKQLRHVYIDVGFLPA